jgi:hypothetical protein
MAGIFSDLIGTTRGYLKLAINGVRLKNSGGNLLVRNTGDTADAEITASAVNVSGNTITLNSDSAGAGDDYKLTLSRPATGMTADVALVLPSDDGTAGQVLVTDGAGNLSFASAANTALCDKVDTTALAFGTSSPAAMFTTGAADVINLVEVVVDEAFDGAAPSLSIGIAGTASKYMATSDVDLKTIGTYQVHPGLVAQGIESLIATLNADSSTAGAARVQVYYATPA